MSLIKDCDKALFFYSENVMQWKECFNLTSSKTKEEFYNEHILDSISFLPFLKEYLNKFKHKDIIDFADFGSGVGIPIIPLYIILSDLNINFYAIDSNHKKCIFLKDTFLKLQKEFNIINDFFVLEKQIKELNRKFDIITFCAFSQIEKIEKIIFEKLSDDGFIFAYKGSLSKTKKEIQSLSLFNSKIIKLNNVNNKERCVVVLTKK